MRSTLSPRRAIAAATLMAVVVLPTPPFWLTTERTRPTLLAWVVGYRTIVAQRIQRVLGMLHPPLCLRTHRRFCEERLEIARAASPVAALEQQVRETVIRAGQVGLEVERVAIVPNRFFWPMRFRERDGHVLQNLGVVGAIPKRELVRRQRGVVVPLSLQRHCLAQVIQALGLQAAIRFPADQATPPGHANSEGIGTTR